MGESYDKMYFDPFIDNFLIQLENEDYKEFSEILDNLFTPENLNFQLINFPNEINRLKVDTDHELWTDSKCLMVHIDGKKECLEFLNKIYSLL